MSLEKILTISGKPGLYQLQNQTRNGFIATSLIDGKKISVSARQNVSILAEIAIYTLTKELPLSEVLTKIFDKEKGGEAISHKSTKDELEEYFFEILPDYDEDRVYINDMKKFFNWYNLLCDYAFFEREKKETDSELKMKKTSDGD